MSEVEDPDGSELRRVAGVGGYSAASGIRVSGERGGAVRDGLVQVAGEGGGCVGDDTAGTKQG